MMQMAGQAVARRSEKKGQETETTATRTNIRAGATNSRAAATDTRAAAKTRRIVVSIADRKLALIDGDSVTKIYEVAVGAAETPSPAGEFLIASRVENPSWYWPGKVIPPGPQNPLGPRWMGLGEGGFGIHGTNQPRTIGQAASHGCIRMRNGDVEELFARVRVGDVVELHGERDAAVALIFIARPGDATPQPHEFLPGAAVMTAAATRGFDAQIISDGAWRTKQE
jgi:lipoprotein-anchoring transpeptidase ErfK/SrfK